METEQLIQLIQAVSASELTQFKYEEKGVKLSFRKGEKRTGYHEKMSIKGTNFTERKEAGESGTELRGSSGGTRRNDCDLAACRNIL